MAGTVGTPTVAQSGNQYYDIGNSSAYFLSQVISISTAGTYTLAWYDQSAAWDGNIRTPLTVSFKGGSVNASQTFTPSYKGTWQADSLSLSLVAGTYTLTFGAGDAAGFDLFIDNVTLTSTSPAVTTIPAAVWLLGSGLLGLIGARRFRK